MNESPFDFNVTDRASFIEFLAFLHKDLLENPERWGNKTLPDFLASMSAYAEDIQGYYDNTNQDNNADVPSWQTFSDIMKGAAIYE